MASISHYGYVDTASPSSEVVCSDLPLFDHCKCRLRLLWQFSSQAHLLFAPYGRGDTGLVLIQLTSQICLSSLCLLLNSCIPLQIPASSSLPLAFYPKCLHPPPKLMHLTLILSLNCSSMSSQGVVLVNVIVQLSPYQITYPSLLCTILSALGFWHIHTCMHVCAHTHSHIFTPPTLLLCLLALQGFAHSLTPSPGVQD